MSSSARLRQRSVFSLDEVQHRSAE